MNQEKILEELFDLGYATSEEKFGNLKIALRSTISEDFEYVESKMTGLKASESVMMQKYAIHKLSCNILRIKGEELSKDDIVKKLNAMAAPFVTKLLKSVKALDKEVQKALGDEEAIENSFFEKDGSQEKVEPSQKA